MTDDAAHVSALVRALSDALLEQMGTAYELDRQAAVARGDGQCAAFCARRIAAIDQERARRAALRGPE